MDSCNTQERHMECNENAVRHPWLSYQIYKENHQRPCTICFKSINAFLHILEVMPNTLAAISLPGNIDIASCQPLLVFEITIRYFFLQNTGHCQIGVNSIDETTQNFSILECSVMEGTFKYHLFQPPCHGQEHLHLDLPKPCPAWH